MNDADERFLADFYRKLASEQKPLEPEFQKVIDDNLWELLEREQEGEG